MRSRSNLSGESHSYVKCLDSLPADVIEFLSGEILILFGLKWLVSSVEWDWFNTGILSEFIIPNEGFYFSLKL